MSTSPITSISGAAAAANAQAQASLNTNYTDFLRLLTTQMQNQDPTNPADTNQITQEIALLSQVQGQLQTNTNLAELLALINTQVNSNAVSYIGKQIDAAISSGGTAKTALNDSQATLVYNLPDSTVSTDVTITNTAGQTVFSGPGTTLVGRNQVQWNGLNNAGEKMPDGIYNFKVVAKDSAGKALTVTTYTSGIVESVDSQDGATNLNLGNGLTVPLGNIQSVYPAGTNPS